MRSITDLSCTSVQQKKEGCILFLEDMLLLNTEFPNQSGDSAAPSIMTIYNLVKPCENRLSLIHISVVIGATS